MGAVRTQATAHLRRRRLQAVIVGGVLCLASGAATIALDVLVESQAPYDNAFAQANGAHLVLRVTTDTCRPPSWSPTSHAAPRHGQRRTLAGRPGRVPMNRSPGARAAAYRHRRSRVRVGRARTRPSIGSSSPPVGGGRQPARSSSRSRGPSSLRPVRRRHDRGLSTAGGKHRSERHRPPHDRAPRVAQARTSRRRR